MGCRRFALLLLLLAPVTVRAEEELSAAERVTNLRTGCSKAHCNLGMWAANKKLGREALAHLNIAIGLDPECRNARRKLGHRLLEDGTWDRSKERTIKDVSAAREKHGKAFAGRESLVYEEEARAYEQLGLALRSEGHPNLARELLLHAHFLAPDREATAKGLSLARIAKGFGPEKLAKEMNSLPSSAQSGGAGFVKALTGAATKVRTCGTVDVEVAGPAAAAAQLAVIGNRALVYTTRRFTEEPIRPGWVLLALTSSREQFELLLDRANMDEATRQSSKAIGSARIYNPRFSIATYYYSGTDPVKLCAPIFVHMFPENIIWTLGGNTVPFWFTESVGIDAELTILGSARTVCITWESSQGLVTKDAFQDVARWPRLLCRRAALGDLPKLEHLRTAQVQSLSGEDIVAAHAHYRLLCLTRSGCMGLYLTKLREGKEDQEAYREAFGETHEETTARLVRVLLGGKSGP